MDENGLTQAEVARAIGCHQSVLSDFFAGRRGLSKANAMKLGEYFAITPAVFLKERGGGAKKDRQSLVVAEDSAKGSYQLGRGRKAGDAERAKREAVLWDSHLKLLELLRKIWSLKPAEIPKRYLHELEKLELELRTLTGAEQRAGGS